MAISISKIGYCKYEFRKAIGSGSIQVPDPWENPVDNSEGRVVQFSFNYSWSNNNCTISNITWTPGKIEYNASTGARTFQSVSLQSAGFKQQGKLTINFGTVSPTIAAANNYIYDKTKTYSASSVTVSNVSQKYLLANFIYKYEAPAPDNDTSGVNYIVEIKNIKIPKTSKYEKNVVFTEDGIKELITNIKKYPVIDINATPEDSWENGQPSITVTHGNSANTKKVKVGSNIKFINPSDNSEITSEASGNQQIGTFRVKINNKAYEVPVKGLSGGTGDTFDITVSTASTAEKLSPGKKLRVDLASTSLSSVYTGVSDVTDIGVNGILSIGNGGTGLTASPSMLTNLSSTNADTILKASPRPGVTGTLPTGNGGTGLTEVAEDSLLIGNSQKKITTITVSGLKTKLNIATNYIKDNADHTATGVITLSKGTNITVSNGSASGGTLILSGSGGILAGGNIWGTKVYNAVFNDYAECRTTINLTPGHVIIDNDDGSLSCSSERLQPGGQIISDTYGHLMGMTEKATTPIAVAGRVLVYTYQSRENYHAGMAVCSAPNGTVDIMTREEIRDYPDCIIGIVSEIPQYETWGSDNVKVDGRIWIKVK